MKTSGLKHDVWAKHTGCSNLSSLWRKVSGMVMAGLVLLTASFLTLTVQAQTTMTIKPTPQRIEVPTGNANTYYVTNCALRIPTNGASYLTNYDTANTDPTSYTNWVIAPVNVSISGAPAGCTASLVDSGLVNPIGTINLNLTTNNVSSNTNLVVKLVFDGTEVSGTTNLVITATGAGLPEDDRILPLDVARIWNGAGNAAANGAGSWSDSSQWLGGAPQTGDTVVFNDLGGQTNSLLNGSAFLTNSLVSANVTLSSLRFAVTNSSTNFHNIYINPGVNLAISGTGGFKMLRDYSYWASRMFVYIWGTNGTFIQTNENSSFTLLCGDDQQQSILDMSGLGNLYLDVNAVNIDNFQGYPNYLNAVYTNSMNGTTVGAGKPEKIYGTWRMALTNYVKATFVDPYNYTNPLSRSYTLTIGRDETSGGGSGQDCELNMGYSNVFNLDSICVAGPRCLGADFRFLNANSYAKFRNTDGVSRMSMFATADTAGQTPDASFNDKAKCGGNGLGVDFTKGTVDMLVDRLYCSSDGTNAAGTAGAVACFAQTSGFYFGAGTIDANTVILGYQSQGYVNQGANITNASTCLANMFVSNSAALKVNNTLTLGYTTAPILPVGGSSSGPGFGVLNIGPGGTVMANNITVGGPTKTSAGNVINMKGNASLIVSNSIADATPNGALGSLAMSGNNNSLTLFINGSNPNPVVYLTNFTSSGTGTKLVIGGVKNLTYPADVSLIIGVNSSILINSSSFDAGISMPAGLGLSASFNPMVNNTISIHIINRSPNFTVWRGKNTGGGSGNWDYTTTNWMVLSGPNAGMLTNYENPDVVAFDDTPGVATNIVITGASSLTPGGINMTNNSLYYTLTAGGNQITGGTLNKYGTGTVEVDDQTALSAQINQGTLVGFSPGTIGGASIASGAVMNFFGNMSGSLSCAGTATSHGTISGTLSVLSGGVVTNTGTVNNPVSVQSGGLLYNSGSMPHVGVGSSGSPQVAGSGTMINGGTIDDTPNPGDILYVNGAFKDLGGASTMTLQSVTVGASGTFIPGGDGAGTTTINNDGSTTFDGALLLVQGSTTVLKANPGGSPLNTMVSCAHLSFGASASSQNQNGATLVITNVGGAYSTGQSFRFFDNVEVPGTVPFSTGSSTNTFPVVVPQVPGPGLSWDLSHLWADGSIRVITTPLITLTNSFSIQGGTNVVGQFSWDAAYFGYRLESQINPLSVGLSTNWTGISGSVTNTSWTITNSLSSGSGNVNFYRLVFP